MQDLVAVVMVSLAVFFGAACGAFVVVGVAIERWANSRLRDSERALTREIALHEADNAAAKARITEQSRTVDRLRRRSVELLEACDQALSDAKETRAEARAREREIRRQTIESGFGHLAPAVLLCVLLVISGGAMAGVEKDPRYCGPPPRDASGKIKRSAVAKAEFRRLHACPATQSHKGACPDWAIDHVIPLACGGCDTVANLQWLPTQIKAASGALPKDRFERHIYCAPKPNQ